MPAVDPSQVEGAVHRSRLILLTGIAVLVLAPIAGAGDVGWTPLGPPGGNVFALAIDLTTPTTLYAGTWGGVFKTTTGGASWAAANTGLTASTVRALALDPTSPTTVHAGTYGDSVFLLRPTRVGLYRNGTWYLDTNGNGIWDAATDGFTVNWAGVPGNAPVTGKW